MFCEELFSGIEAKKGGETTFEVKFSMLEIYNEIARDLLDANGAKKKSGLKIRQHPKKGFYGELRTFKVSWFTSKNSLLYFTFSADGLKEVLVNNYDEINARMEEGTVIEIF